MIDEPQSIDAGEESGENATWLSLARDAFEQSSDWLNASTVSTWEQALAHFQNRHASGSRYGTAAYRHRSNIFRPKTRTAVKGHEAAFAAAMFSNADLIDITPEDPDDLIATVGARVMRSMMQMRLERTIPWFTTAVGGYQDSKVYGVAISYSYWLYEEEETVVPMVDQFGQPQYDDMGRAITTVASRVVKDEPRIDLIEPNNLRIDPGADWRNPIHSSPYVIRLVPMHVDDALDMMEKRRGVKWLEADRGMLMAAAKEKYDATRRNRETGRKDSQDSQPSEYEIVWLHENFVRRGGREFVYWTLGTTKMLSEPQPLEEVYLTGRRPFEMGYSTLETHRNYPDSDSAQSAGLQQATNDICNQRLDNVRLALDKRYVLRRGKNIDVEALMRNVPGGGVMTDDPDSDVRVLNTPDVTGSSYQEQDRYDIQFDELFGSFSQGSVANNRQLNETVGGMQLMQAGASAVAEYSIRLFVESWVEPTLRQLMNLIRVYETDERLIKLAAEEADVFRKYRLERVGEEILNAPLDLRVNVGIGATNPMQRVERLNVGLQTAAQFPDVMQKINSNEIVKEIFGALGFKNGKRFFTPPEPEIDPQTGQPAQPPPSPEQMAAQAEQQAAQADMELRQGELKIKAQELQLRQAEIQSRQQLQQQQMLGQARIKQAELAQARELKMMEIALKRDLTLAQLQTKLQVDQEHSAATQILKQQELALKQAEIQTKRDITALQETNKQNELHFKATTGRQGI